MALDRDAEQVLEMVRLSGRPPYETLTERVSYFSRRARCSHPVCPVAEI
jgi:hypothetical protein